jgi:hypothetical protein
MIGVGNAEGSERKSQTKRCTKRNKKETLFADANDFPVTILI